jgi:hypothetical protein
MMRRTLALSGFVTILAVAAVSLIVLPNGTPRAAGGETTFLIAATDGYGVADCLTGGTECGSIVANAWCESQGFSRAESFGLAAPETVTGSAQVGLTPRSERPISITCIN